MRCPKEIVSECHKVSKNTLSCLKIHSKKMKLHLTAIETPFLHKLFLTNKFQQYQYNKRCSLQAFYEQLLWVNDYT